MVLVHIIYFASLNWLKAHKEKKATAVMARRSASFYTLFLTITCHMLLIDAQGNRDVEVVECADQQEACECNSEADACQFQLHIEELQTFTSYKLENDGDVITRGTPGEIYP